MKFATVPHSERFAYLLGRHDSLIADGATGTNLFDRGLETGESPELWNLDRPESVSANHREMVSAGAQILLTNSFGGSAARLRLHGAHDHVGVINRRAAELARQVADSADHPVLVAGSIGPTGELLVPLGDMSREDAAEMFREQAQALVAGGVDLLWVETMSSEEEATEAVEAASTTGLPVICTMTFDTHGRTMMGITPEDAGEFFERSPAAAGGANCGNGFGELVLAVSRMKQACASGTILVAKANCGLPEYVDGQIRYNGTPALMKTYARLARDAGARIIGGCCGSTPEHIRAIVDALEGYVPGSLPGVEKIASSLGLVERPAARRRQRVGARKAQTATDHRTQELRKIKPPDLP